MFSESFAEVKPQSHRGQNNFALWPGRELYRPGLPAVPGVGTLVNSLVTPSGAGPRKTKKPRSVTTMSPFWSRLSFMAISDAIRSGFGGRGRRPPDTAALLCLRRSAQHQGDRQGKGF